MRISRRSSSATAITTTATKFQHLWYHPAAELTKEQHKSHIGVLICRVDDPITDTMTELTAFDLPPTDVTALRPETALNDLESTTHETGIAILQRLLQTQWETMGAELVEQYR